MLSINVPHENEAQVLDFLDLLTIEAGWQGWRCSFVGIFFPKAGKPISTQRVKGSKVQRAKPKPFEPLIL
jgi:hypothetical protein